MSDAFIVFSNLSFSWPDDTPVFQDLSFTVGAGRTGLVAPNGAGKSTLLRLVAGELRPGGGTVTVGGVVGYLPQDLPFTGDLTVAEVLGIAPVLRALHAVETGDAREERDEQKIVLELPDTRVPAGRTLFVGERIRVRDLFAGDGIDLAIRGPERIALTGPNGTGKSTLLRMVQGELSPDAGTTARADGRSAYLSQRLDVLDRDRTVADSLAAAAPGMPQSQRMHLLARFLFRHARIHLPVRALSGGERLRATLACVLFAEPAPQLLLLDEPTNNLDLVSVGQLESALTAYEGAFVVVSHDERFLTEIGVDRWLHLADGRLRETGRPDGN